MQLTAIEVRILGCLIEKEATTPDNYPLSLNALTNACNQTSNRDPIMEVADDAVRWAINNLRQQSLVRAQQGIGSRVMKYQHLVTERMSLEPPLLAVMCTLMLRGPQTTGEIRGRTSRLADVANLSDVEATLNELVTRELVVELTRRPGQKEVRYAHLLSGPVTTDTQPSGAPSASTGRTDDADERTAPVQAMVAELRKELAELRAEFEAFKQQFG